MRYTVTALRSTTYEVIADSTQDAYEQFYSGDFVEVSETTLDIEVSGNPQYTTGDK